MFNNTFPHLFFFILPPCRLAKGICNQIKERIKRSHQAFESSLKLLEAKHGGRIEKTEEHRLRVRKEFAPRVARLSLESRSLRDLIQYGWSEPCIP